MDLRDDRLPAGLDGLHPVAHGCGARAGRGRWLSFNISLDVRQPETFGAWINLRADISAVKHTVQHGFVLSIEALGDICPGHDSVEAMKCPWIHMEFGGDTCL